MRNVPTILPKRTRAGKDTRREAFVILVMLIVFGTGVAVTVDAPGPESTGFPVNAPLYSERAVFCPPVPDGTKGVTDLAISPLVEAPAGVLVEPLDAAPEELEPGEVVARRVDPSFPHNVVGYGSLLGVTKMTSFTEPVRGSAATSCSSRVSPDWYFPQGSSADGFNQLLVIYNPFPDDAVVRITFFTPDGARDRAGLSDVAVPSGRSTTIALNDFILQQPVLATQVSAVRGRMVAWKSLFTRGLAPGVGAGFTLGAPRTALAWYLPGASLERGVRERLSLVNPTDEEAVVTVSLVTEGEAIQPPGLLEMSLPRRSSRSLNLHQIVDRELLGERPGGAGLVVTSVNEVEIAVERSAWYEAPSKLRGFATQIGSSTPANTWWMGPAMTAPRRDWIAVLNTGDNEARVSLAAAGPGSENIEIPPVTIPPGGRARIPLGASDTATVFFLSSDSPVVAERTAFDGQDVATVMGVPVTGPAAIGP
jgi:hypothetical protein